MVQTRYLKGRPTIGVLAGWQVFSGTMDSFLEHVFRGIRAAARDYHCNLLIACSLGEPRETGLGRPAWPILCPGIDFVPVGPWNTDGLLIVPPLALEIGNFYFNDLYARGFPLVYAGCRETGPAVIVDNVAGILQAMAHLVEHGHHRIAFISGRQNSLLDDSGQRLAAYREGVKKWSLTDDPALIAQGFHTVQGGRQAMMEILSRRVPFSAVVASNDESAIGAIEVLQSVGKQIPQDVAVIGFDDRLEARASLPQLTTVHHPMFEMGYRSLELLLKILQGHAPKDRLISITPHLIIRTSCGCRPGLERELRGLQMGDSVRLPQVHTVLKPFPISNMSSSLNLTLEGIIQEMTEVVGEIHDLSRSEVYLLCQHLVKSFQSSLLQENPKAFYSALQRVLEQTSSQEDDLQTWQYAISILRQSFPALNVMTRTSLSSEEVEEWLHQARLEISAGGRGQYARLLVQQSRLANQIGLLSARLLTARDENEVLSLFSDSLSGFGIKRVVVAFFEPQGEDPVAWSLLRLPQELAQSHPRFPSREFPPEWLLSSDQPFELILLPLHVQEGKSGYVAFEAENPGPCADIVRQLAAALRGVHLYQLAVEARRQAEEDRQTAEEASRLKSRFLSIVSHELRTPLNLISGLSDILLQETFPLNMNTSNLTMSRKDLERIYIAAQHLDSLIRDVLDLAHSDSGQLKLNIERVNINELLASIASMGEQMSYDKGLSWRLEVSEGLPEVWGDATRLRQVILNLISNAVKFTHQGEICLSANCTNGQVLISVKDTGLGIPPEEHELIFDEFRQSERTSMRGYGGLGLGLAISKRLVEMHGGKIGVQSSGVEGQGSTVYFTLPAATTEQTFHRPESLSSFQVLLLTDDLSGETALKGHLERHGVSVRIETFSSNFAGLFPSNCPLPDLILLDAHLAAARGWEILKQVREFPPTSQTPVISYALEDGAGSMLELDFLTKPLNVTKLAEVLRSYHSAEEGNGKSKSILVVDDDPDSLDVNTRLVEMQLPEYQVLRAQNGREALHILQKSTPALVLLDLVMPELDGFSVLETMRAHQELRSIPVIVLTGQPLSQQDIERLNKGVAYVLGKGLFTAEETIQRITAAISRKRGSGTEAQRAVLKAMSYIHNHYAEPISRRSIADHVGMSERHLTRCFHQETGITLISYLNRYRIRQAKVLLDAGETCITDVALAVGFSSSGYFTRVFHQEMGISPRAYLRGQRPASSKP